MCIRDRSSILSQVKGAGERGGAGEPGSRGARGEMRRGFHATMTWSSIMKVLPASYKDHMTD